MFFKDRADAGKRLGGVIKDTGRDFSGYQVVGLARGGVIVGAEVADLLGISMQSLCIDDHSITEKKVLVCTSLGTGLVRQKDPNVSRFVPDIHAVEEGGVEAFYDKLMERSLRYNLGEGFAVPKKAIVCDDGLVSGETALLAIRSLRYFGIEEVLLAVPVVPPWFAEKIRNVEVITWRTSTIKQPKSGIFYFNFNQTTDEEVINAVSRCNNSSGTGS